MKIVLLVSFFLIILSVTLFILFRKDRGALPDKIHLTYINGIITLVSALIYSLITNEDSFWPIFVQTWGILSVISIIIMNKLRLGIWWKKAN